MQDELVFTVRLPGELSQKLADLARASERTKGSVVRMLIRGAQLPGLTEPGLTLTVARKQAKRGGRHGA